MMSLWWKPMPSFENELMKEGLCLYLLLVLYSIQSTLNKQNRFKNNGHPVLFHFTAYGV